MSTFDNEARHCFIHLLHKNADYNFVHPESLPSYSPFRGRPPAIACDLLLASVPLQAVLRFSEEVPMFGHVPSS